MSALRATLAQLNSAMRSQAEQKLRDARARHRHGAGKRVPADRLRRRGYTIPVLNKATETLRMQLRAEMIPGFVTEYAFHPTRGWRFDWANLPKKLAVEIEGITFEGGRHQRWKGFHEDCAKYAEALVLGWRVLRVTPLMVKRGEAINYIKRALNMT